MKKNKKCRTRVVPVEELIDFDEILEDVDNETRTVLSKIDLAIEILSEWKKAIIHDLYPAERVDEKAVFGFIDGLITESGDFDD